jgi:hypothetical protein
MASSGFVDLDHTADWAIRVRGVDLVDLFLQAAAGLLSLANPTPAPGPASSHVHLRRMAARASGVWHSPSKSPNGT